MIETARLVLRQWRDADREPFAAMRLDPEVMAHLPPLTREESDAAVDRQMALIAEHGHGFWAVERKADGAFLGFTGVKPTAPDLPFDGAPEVGWRLARHAWGAGYASEAARASLAYGFKVLGAPEIVSFTVPANTRSQAVMRRIGMTADPTRNFDHPVLPAGHRLRPHVLYALRRPHVTAGER